MRTVTRASTRPDVTMPTVVRGHFENMYWCMYDLCSSKRRTSSGPRDGQYQTFEEFASDVLKVFSNAILYHGGRGGCDGDEQVR